MASLSALQESNLEMWSEMRDNQTLTPLPGNAGHRPGSRQNSVRSIDSGRTSVDGSTAVPSLRGSKRGAMAGLAGLIKGTRLSGSGGSGSAQV